MYPFDPTRSKFFFLDIDQQHASASSQITLYSVDPADGSSTATPVTGAKGFVMSFEYHPESATMVVAVGDRKYGPSIRPLSVALASPLIAQRS